jgi:hypothetical protein
MKTALKYIGLTLLYAFIFAIRFLRAFLRLAFSPEVMKGMKKEEQRKELERIYADNDFDPLFHPDNLSNPIKKFKGW